MGLEERGGGEGGLRRGGGVWRFVVFHEYLQSEDLVSLTQIVSCTQEQPPADLYLTDAWSREEFTPHPHLFSLKT